MKRILIALILAAGWYLAPVTSSAQTPFDRCYQVNAAAITPVMHQGGEVQVWGQGSCPHRTAGGQTVQAAQFRLRLQQPGGLTFIEYDFQRGNRGDTAMLWTVPTTPGQGAQTWTFYADVCPWVGPTGCIGPVTTVSGTFRLL